MLWQLQRRWEVSEHPRSASHRSYPGTLAILKALWVMLLHVGCSRHSSPPPSPDSEQLSAQPGSLASIQSVESPAPAGTLPTRRPRGVSFDAESPDERLAAPLLMRRSWSTDSDGASTGVLPPTVSTVVAEQSGMPSGLVRAVAVILSIAIVRSQQPPALSPHAHTPTRHLPYYYDHYHQQLERSFGGFAAQRRLADADGAVAVCDARRLAHTRRWVELLAALVCSSRTRSSP